MPRTPTNTLEDQYAQSYYQLNFASSDSLQFFHHNKQLELPLRQPCSTSKIQSPVADWFVTVRLSMRSISPMSEKKANARLLFAFPWLHASSSRAPSLLSFPNAQRSPRAEECLVGFARKLTVLQWKWPDFINEIAAQEGAPLTRPRGIRWWLPDVPWNVPFSYADARRSRCIRYSAT